MMHRVERPTKRRGLPFYLPAALVLLAVLTLPGVAHAQWATTGNNISNTNTGNVGVGTSTPSAKLVVRGNSSDSNAMPGIKFENSADSLACSVRIQNYYPGLTYFAANVYRDPADGSWHLDNAARGGTGITLNTEEWTAGIRNYLQLWAAPPTARGWLTAWCSGRTAS